MPHEGTPRNLTALEGGLADSDDLGPVVDGHARLVSESELLYSFWSNFRHLRRAHARHMPRRELRLISSESEGRC